MQYLFASEPNISKQIVLEWFPIVAVVMLLVAPVVIATGYAAGNTAASAAIDESGFTVMQGLQGIGLSSPLAKSFEAKSHAANTRRAQYYYEKNGVSITVSYDVYEPGKIPDIKEITESVSHQLSQAVGLELIDLKYRYVANQKHHPQGVFHSAKFLM